MMPKEEENLNYSNEDKEIQMVMNNQLKNEDEIDETEAGPSAKKSKIAKKKLPVDDIITISSDGFVSVNNTSTNPSKSKNRKQLRHTIDEIKSGASFRKREEERIKRLEQQRNNDFIIDSYKPIQVPIQNVIKDESIIVEDGPSSSSKSNGDVDVIEINSDDEEDDMPEVIGVFQNPKTEVKCILNFSYHI